MELARCLLHQESSRLLANSRHRIVRLLLVCMPATTKTPAAKDIHALNVWASTNLKETHTWYAVVMMADLMAIGPHLGYLVFSNAAMPATCGVAMLVPANNSPQTQHCIRSSALFSGPLTWYLAGATGIR